MKINMPPFVRRFLSFAALLSLTAGLAACTGTGGGQLPPAPAVGFNGAASFGFDFSCERSSRSTSPNPPAGQLRIEVAYTDHGTSLIGSSFGIHGIVDEIDPIVESAYCIGRNAPPGGKELIFLGRYWPTTPPPAEFPSSCRQRATSTTPSCRFEIIVRDNDEDLAPSRGDFFSIKLSTVTNNLLTELPVGTVFYARAGLLSSGNLTVK